MTAVVVVLVANLLIALGGLLCHAAYASGDPSGLQYMFLLLALYVIAPAAVLLTICGLATPALRRALLPLVSAAGVFVAATLPQLTGLGYNGSRLDGPGAVLAACVLALHLPLAVISTRAALRARRPPRQVAAR